MPLYEITAPSGQVYEIEGPENASEQSLILAAKRREREDRIAQLRQRAQEAANIDIPPDTTFGGYLTEVPKAVGRGAINLLETAGVGASAALRPEYEKKAREAIADIAGVGREALKADRGYEDTVTTRLAEGLGSTLPFFALGPLGPAARVAGAGLGMAAGAGEARQRAEAQGATGEERRTATLLGAPTGLLDTLAPQIKPFKSLMLTAAARGGVEGATEAAQKVAQNLIAKGVYDPSQPIVEGAGEEGAYGAGVGALASLIIDLTIGRKARRAALAGEQPAAETPPTSTTPTTPTTPAAPLGLGYEAEEFTPVVMPDGSVITSRAEAEAYQQQQDQTARARAKDVRASDPMTGMPQGQRDLARGAKQRQLEEAFAGEQPKGQLELPGVERADGTVEVPGRGRVTPQPVAEPAAPAPAPVADTQTRDMVEEFELSEIERILRGDPTPEEAAATEAERAAQAEAKKRVDTLMPIIALRDVDVPAEFTAALDRAGLDTNITEGERQLIDRADAVREAVNAQDAEMDINADVSAMEARIPERQAQPVGAPIGEQAGLPGMSAKRMKERAVPEQREPGTPALEGVEQGAEVSTTPFSPVLTSDLLDGTGLPRQSGFYKQLLDKDVSVPEQQTQVRDVLAKVRTNDKLSPATKQAIEGVAMQAFGSLATQQELFTQYGTASPAAKGSVKAAERVAAKGKPAETKRADKPNDDTGAGAGAGTRRPDTAKKQPAGEAATPAGTTEAPKPSGLGDTGKPAAESGTGKGAKPAPVKRGTQRTALEVITGKKEPPKPKAAAKKGAPETEAKTEPKTEPKTEAKKEEVKENTDNYMAVSERNYQAQKKVERLQKAFDKLDNAVETDNPARLAALKKLRDAEEEARKTLAELVGTPVSKAAPKTEAKKEAPKTEAKKEAPKTEAKKQADKDETPTPKNSTAIEAISSYMLAAKNLPTALRYLAWDMYAGAYPDAMSVGKRNQTLNRIKEKLLAGDTTGWRYGDLNPSGLQANSGGRFAKAFFESLNPTQRETVLSELKSYFFEQDAATNAAFERMNMQQKLAREEKQEQEGDTEFLEKDARALRGPLHPAVIDRLRANDLLGALDQLAKTSSDPRVRNIARILRKNFKGTAAVEVSDFSNPTGALKRILDSKPDVVLEPNTSGFIAVNADGESVIFLDSQFGMDAWSLLHEVTHHATLGVLGNKNHPLTKQLQELYNNVKDSLDTAYGATSLEEFVAEVFSNPKFQERLSRINPKGEPVSALRKFINSVGNFLRRMLGQNTKGIDSALSAADNLITQIVAGPQGTTTTTGEVSFLKKDWFDTAVWGNKAIDKGLDAEKVGAIHEMLTQTPQAWVKNVIRQGLPLNALVDVAKKYIPMAPQLDVLVGEKSGSENNRNQRLEQGIAVAEKWAKANKDKLPQFNRVVADSTLAGVDPSKPRSEYVGKTDESGNKKDAAWDSLQADWNALGESGRNLYSQMRDTYRGLYDQLYKTISTRIDNTIKDKDSASALKAEIYKKLFEAGKIDPYFPLTRRGDHWLAYDFEGERYVEAYESTLLRDRAAKEVEAAGGTNVQKYANIDKIDYRNAPPESFISTVMRTLEANKVGADVEQQIMRAFLNTLPETSFAQAFRKRKGTLGFKDDAIGALRVKSFNISRQLSNFEYGSKFYKLIDEMREYVRTQGGDEVSRDLLRELEERAKYAISPNIPKWSKIATSFGFNMTLGFNVSSALVNLSQVPLVVQPYLGGKYGQVEATKALARAAKTFIGSGFTREIDYFVPTGGKGKGETKVKVKAGPSLDNYDFAANPELAHLKTLADVAGSRGQLNRSQAYDILDVGEDASILNRVNAATGFVFHHGERMNRQVAMIAAYELELQRLVGKDKKLSDATEGQRTEAANYALEVTELTNGGTAAAAAPRLAQSGIGKVVFMYKRYGASMYYMLFKTANEAFFNKKPDGVSDKEWELTKTVAKRQLAGIFAASALMAGAQGLPLYGVVAMLYNLILKGEDDDDFDTAARKYLGEGIYNGAVNALTGTAIAQRVGLSNLIFREAPSQAGQDDALMSAITMLGGPVLGSMQRVQRGLQLINDGYYERGIEQMMPAAIGNALKSIRFGTEGAQTLRGDPITGEIGPWNIGAQFFGFAPAEYTRQLEINSNVKAFDRKAAERKTRILRSYYMAARQGDGEGMQDALEDMMKYNRRYPSNSITADSIQRSMAQHMRTTQEMYHGISLSKALRPQWMQYIAEYED